MKKFSCKPKPIGTIIQLGDVSRGNNGDFIELGRLAESGPIIPVRLLTGKPIVVAIVGKRGSGKSYTLGSIAESLCAKNDSSSLGQRKTKQAQLLFDTLGIFQWMATPVTGSGSSEIVASQALNLRGWSLSPEELITQTWIPKESRYSWSLCNPFSQDGGVEEFSSWASRLAM